MMEWRKTMTCESYHKLRFSLNIIIKSLSRRLMFKYFSLRFAVAMAVLTVFLVVLPLVLPSLPPPPLILLVVPVLIMALLTLLAFSSSEVPNGGDPFV
ncbi:hypothetical protein U1Q18_007770 [Sarracenia purpurea var. burkii]